MKKLIMAVAAVFAVASIASAASITWGTTGQSKDGSGNPIDGGTAYLVYLGDNGTLDATFNGTSWDMGDDQIVDSASISGHVQAPSTTSSWGYYKKTSTVPGGVGSVYSVIVTSDGVSGTELPTSGYYGVTGTYTQQKAGATDTETFTNTAQINVSTEITPVPEPTTYALIGIAAAALALRKRFLKK